MIKGTILSLDCITSNSKCHGMCCSDFYSFPCFNADNSRDAD